MKDEVLNLCMDILKLDGMEKLDCSKVNCKYCPFSFLNAADKIACIDRDYKDNIRIAKNYIASKF